MTSFNLAPTATVRTAAALYPIEECWWLWWPWIFVE
jgi:hypothetical protein